ncbi:MAG TPA: DUF4834 domain-containing protein [Cyclobacteriaceae bacterium]|nr:DUF4834 domain-containing protein [Cyclobacteriaceae bacterium]
MLRLILIFSLIGYVLYKLGLFKIIVNNQVRGQQPRSNFDRRPPDGSVNVDSAPKHKKGTDFKGGEYVDYEEVK